MEEINVEQHVPTDGFMGADYFVWVRLKEIYFESSVPLRANPLLRTVEPPLKVLRRSAGDDPTSSLHVPPRFRTTSVNTSKKSCYDTRRY